MFFPVDCGGNCLRNTALCDTRPDTSYLSAFGPTPHPTHPIQTFSLCICYANLPARHPHSLFPHFQISTQMLLHQRGSPWSSHTTSPSSFLLQFLCLIHGTCYHLVHHITSYGFLLTGSLLPLSPFQDGSLMYRLPQPHTSHVTLDESFNASKTQCSHL